MTEKPTLGGSTIAAAVGVDPYCSPIRLWLDMIHEREREESEAMRWGTLLEPLIIDEVESLGYIVRRETLFEYVDDEREWLIGHPDAFILDDGDYSRPPSAVLEVKTANQWAARANGPIPVNYQAQAQTYMHLTGTNRALLATLVGGQRLELHELARSQHAIDTLLALAERFMRYVWEREQPPPQGHPDDRAALLEAWPDAVPKSKRENNEVREARLTLASLLAREKTWRDNVEGCRAVITSHMGDADTLTDHDDVTVATWRNVTSTRLDAKRLKEEKPDIYEMYTTETTTRRFVLT